MEHIAHHKHTCVLDANSAAFDRFQAQANKGQDKSSVHLCISGICMTSPTDLYVTTDMRFVYKSACILQRLISRPQKLEGKSDKQGKHNIIITS